ncbi:heterokaryon incompatibility protein [Colletotrichum kahawae]|uniref:Heterokaryon incompatibility protein n=1 Tax=Colletotrichum kahawae TaxID=34407 RepID=A0AAD9Y3Y6_COLKA|nr:heterokaryon incompatibility protein [Colletotrichum kahawae]
MDLTTPEPPDSFGETIATINCQVPGTWAERYLAANGDDVGADSDVVQEVEKDEIDHQKIKIEIQRLAHTMNIVDGFCGKCRDLFEHWPDLSVGEWPWTQGRSFSSVCEIEAAASAGCKLCAFIHWRLVHERLLSTFQRIESRLRASGHNGSTSLTLQNWGDGPFQSHIMWLNFPGKEATHCNNPGAQSTKFISDLTEPSSWQESRDVYDLARMWLRECDSSHEVCLKQKKYERPARLLSFDRDYVRVVHTEALDTMPQYATLSYCWGLKPFLSLTKNTMSSFREGVSVRDLPQTFRDAIHVAKQLGLSYIWIDALCIIQQDPEDWSIESSRMRSVYGNSYVNLAASSATNVDEGFFSKTERYKYYSGGLYARITTNEYSAVRNFYGDSVYEESFAHTHLATRAWTLQERLLPARTIYFGNTGIFWECRSGFRSEFLLPGIRSLFGSHLVSSEDQAWSWGEIVSHYSRAYLTDPEDHLPALAGIARRQQEVTGHQYLAGMWRESFITELPWAVIGRRRRPAWRAPSWSWIAVDSPILVWGWDIDLKRDGVNMKQYTSVTDAWTTLSSLDPFGKVSDGLLSLACSVLVYAHLLRPADFQEISDEYETSQYQFVRVKGSNKTFPVFIDALSDEENCGEVCLLPIYGGSNGCRWARPRAHKGEQDDDMKEPEAQGEWIDDLMICGLVLRACGQNSGDESRFCRIGSFNLRNLVMYPKFDQEPGRDYYAEFIQALDGRGHEPVDAKRPTETVDYGYVQRNLSITVE